MVEVTVIDATNQHAWYIAEHMREDDVNEMIASGLTPLRACTRAIQSATWAKTACRDGVPVCIFGVSPISVLGGSGAPWLLGTDDVVSIRVQFIRQCRGYVELMLKSFPVLKNFVDCRNELSIRWLTWLGFEILPEQASGVNGELFYPFEMRAS